MYKRKLTPLTRSCFFFNHDTSLDSLANTFDGKVIVSHPERWKIEACGALTGWEAGKRGREEGLEAGEIAESSDAVDPYRARVKQRIKKAI